MKRQYYVDLIGRLYKLLIFYEKFPDSFRNYLYNLKLEIRGNEDFSQMQKIYYMLNYLYIYNITHDDVRKVSLDSIGIINGIIDNWKEITND